ncbi:MAG TPA: RNA polymerase sigma factor [Flavobacteriales bacterium]
MITDELIARCARKDARAQYELYRALYGTMMAICSRYEKNLSDAKDRMNQGFLKILENIGNRGNDVPFEPWARRILINTVIDGFRKEQRRKEHEQVGVDQTMDSNPGINEYLQQMEAEALTALMQRLPGMSRQVFNLFAIDGYGHAEIASMLGISEGTSKWHVSTARAQLQRALQEGWKRSSVNIAIR